ncbi:MULTISPECIES: acyl carrier protein [unclassified Luteococcus]|uniref:acyl carrier protein n=1 Tax=unclassified Luteococcus TaxID=2639923 RepID=UPI00313AF5DB
MLETTQQTIRTILAEHARLECEAATLGVDDDLYAAGMTSHASVNVMLALEDELDIEFPDELLNKETFGSIARIAAALDGLQD